MSFDPGVAEVRRLVLDTNILIRAILGRRVLDLIEEYSDRVRLFTADAAYDDVREHLPRILVQRGLSPVEVTDILDTLLVDRLPRLVTRVPPGVYESREVEARQRLTGRDESDWPFVALALILNCPIWTEDQDFFGSGIATWTTDRIRLFLSS